MSTRVKQTPPVTQEPSTTSNHKSTSYDHHTKSGYDHHPPLLTLPTQHTTAAHPAHTPTHYHTPIVTHYLTTHQTTITLYPNPPPLQAISYTVSHLQLLLNSFICLKHSHSHPKQTILLFPTSSSHLNPRPHAPIPRMGTSEQQKWAQLRMTIIFFLWEVMHNNN